MLGWLGWGMLLSVSTLGACSSPAQTNAMPPPNMPPERQFVCADHDGDGFGATDCMYVEGKSVPVGYSPASTISDDCDDTNPNVHPMAPEVCDGIDNDCNGEIDDDDSKCPFTCTASGECIDIVDLKAQGVGCLLLSTGRLYCVDYGLQSGTFIAGIDHPNLWTVNESQACAVGQTSIVCAVAGGPSYVLITASNASPLFALADLTYMAADSPVNETLTDGHQVAISVIDKNGDLFAISRLGGIEKVTGPWTAPLTAVEYLGYVECVIDSAAKAYCTNYNGTSKRAWTALNLTGVHRLASGNGNATELAYHVIGFALTDSGLYAIDIGEFVSGTEYKPRKIMGMDSAVQFAAGDKLACGSDAQGTLGCWIGSVHPHTGIKRLGMIGWGMCGLTQEGQVQCWPEPDQRPDPPSWRIATRQVSDGSFLLQPPGPPAAHALLPGAGATAGACDNPPDATILAGGASMNSERRAQLGTCFAKCTTLDPAPCQLPCLDSRYVGAQGSLLSPACTRCLMDDLACSAKPSLDCDNAWTACAGFPWAN